MVGAGDVVTVAPGSRQYSLMHLSNTYEQVDGSEKTVGCIDENSKITLPPINI